MNFNTCIKNEPTTNADVEFEVSYYGVKSLDYYCVHKLLIFSSAIEYSYYYVNIDGISFTFFLNETVFHTLESDHNYIMMLIITVS